jgi:hypothetical protein
VTPRGGSNVTGIISRSHIRFLASEDGARRPDGWRFNGPVSSRVSCTTRAPWRSIMMRAIGQRATAAR